MTDQPPDYILVTPQDKEVPRIEASCDREDIDDLKEIKAPGMYIYKLVGRK
jgi:hypothetical protein